MTALTGITGIASIQGVEAIVPQTGVPAIDIVKLAVQVIIGIITIFKLVKKPKINTEESVKNTQDGL